MLFSVGPVAAQVPTPAPPNATADVHDASGRLLATATFREGHGEVLINLTFPNPPVLSGTHAIHINETGRCDPPDFSTSGNIFNPFNKQHGRQNTAGYEIGDLPNVNLATGLTSYNTTASGATLGQGATSLLNPGRALVIFAGEDDQNTPPEGNAGARMGCGVITASTAAAPAAAAQQPAAPAQPAAGVAPTATSIPTPNVAAAAPRIASPVPVQGQAPQGQPPAVAAQGQAPQAQAPQVQQAAPAAAGQAAQPAAPGQPGQAAVPANSPVVVPKPVVVNNNAVASPVPAVAVAQGQPAQPVAAGQPGQPVVAAPAQPTPVVIQPTAQPLVAAAQTPQTSSGSNTNALIIAVLGVGLVGVGYLLRRRRQLQ